MQKLSQVTNLVHVGFDRNPQEDFETRVLRYLEETSEITGHILNFVDESEYSLEDIELMEQNYFAKALSNCLGVQSARSLSISDGRPEEIILRQLAWIPREILAAIKEILGDDWEAMAQRIPSYETWRDTRKAPSDYLSGKADSSELVLPEDIQKQISNQDGIVKRIKTHEFEDILQELQKRFGGRNIFGFHAANIARNDIVKNPERRERIIHRANELFGNDRIIFSSMRDGDTNKLLHAFLGEEWDKEIAQHWIDTEESFGVKFEISDYLYGNADRRLQRQNRQITVDRFERFRIDAAKQILYLGYQMTESTMHILGGEYYHRCVASWADVLGLYGAPKDRIFIEPEISLVHPDDI